MEFILKELLKKLRYSKDEGKFYWLESGDEAGYSNLGYRYIWFEGAAYAVHHLVWFTETGDTLTNNSMLDHRDLNRSNNRIGNLRYATKSQNALNIKAHKDSITGVKGVEKLPNGKYRVRVTVNGKVKHFGCYEALELAELVATEVRDKYHGEYARS